MKCCSGFVNSANSSGIVFIIYVIIIFVGYSYIKMLTPWFENVRAYVWIVGIPSTLVTYKFGYRVSVMFGGVLACTGFALSFFCTELHELYLCIGALAGKCPIDIIIWHVTKTRWQFDAQASMCMPPLAAMTQLFDLVATLTLTWILAPRPSKLNQHI